ncbi:cerebellin-1-like [Saccostrea echinata]|uniref:cerebellin-1-like n=1 Tax=Saccostrea echinata TaxID=191078 RepID=UPI002A823D8C|nr:cerebellin-1-like [Saccostrea echinata]
MEKIVDKPVEKELLTGTESVKDAAKSGRRMNVTGKANVSKVEEIIESDDRHTICDIANAASISLSFQNLKVVVAIFLLTAVNADGITKDFIKKFNTYNEVCRGMGFKDGTCKGSEKGMIAFHARTSTHQKNLRSNAVVVFGKVTLNIGSAYDRTTGKFTAPRNGIYSFTWTSVTAAGSWFNTVIVHDNNVIGYNIADGNAGSRTMSAGSATAIIKMKKNDKVWIRPLGGQARDGYANWCSFSGFQLF